MDGLSYLPGAAPGEAGLLGRFLPPIPEGAASGFLAVHAGPESWVLDPFGAAPALDVEIARAGYRVLAAVNNPVGRFLLDLAADPPAADDLRAALSVLAASRKGQDRLETHLQALYLTRCGRCRRPVQAEAFVWERGGQVPVGRLYRCPCGEGGEFPVEAEDCQRAEGLLRLDSLHRSRALERVAAPDDPDRKFVEEALECYLPRAVYFLITLVNKLEGLELTPPRRRALLALLLGAVDEGNTLWPYPAERPRPRQLTVPPRFLEKNLWLALERLASAWRAEPPLPVLTWSELAADPARAEAFGREGGLCIFEGPVRDLARHLRTIHFGALVTALPRPNQAFWSLSALWSGWLWGREAAAPFKPVLRRRRYEWNWHAAAVYAALKNLSERVPLNAPFLALIPEAEPAFLSAGLLAAAGAGFDLSGLALRTRHDPLHLVWHRRAFVHGKVNDPTDIDPESVRESMTTFLRERGEPASYLHLHAAALAGMAANRSLGWREEALASLQAPIQAGLAGPEFIHHSESATLETGLWGLADWSGAAEPLPDRVEVAVVRFLQDNPSARLEQIECAVYGAFPGLQTPSRALLQAVLASYATESGGTWSLRPGDTASSRRADLEACEGLLAGLASRLGFDVERPAGSRRIVLWRSGDRLVYAIHLAASAVVGRLLRENPHSSGRCLLVLPGGRAGLLAYKLERDPGLKALAEGWRLVKFRQLRRLAESANLDFDRWEKGLAGDPIEAPEQLKLL